MARLKLAIGMLCLALLAACSGAPEKELEPLAPVVVEAGVTKATALIGEKIDYTLTVEYDDGVQFEIPDFTKGLADFGVVDFESGESVSRETGRPVIRKRYTLESFELGSYKIPGPTVSWVREDGAPGEVAAPDLYVEIVSSIAEGDVLEDIRDIAPPVALLEDLTRQVLLYSAGGLALLAVLAALILIARRRGKVEAPPPPPKPAHVVFFDELRRIRELKLPMQGRVKEYVYLVNAALRRYVEDRFEMRAPEKTTEEFLPELRDAHELTGQQKEMIRKFLKSCDLVKYARHQPDREETDEMERWATEFVMQTRLEPSEDEDRAAQEAGA